MSDLTELVEVTLPNADAFLLIAETLTRIGVASSKEHALYQSCHILHKQNKYYIVHFLEMLKLDGKSTNISSDDLARRNTIAGLLEQWGLCSVVVPEMVVEKVAVSKIKIIPFKEKDKWSLKSKYTIGNRK